MANYELFITKKATKEAVKIPKNYLLRINKLIKKLIYNPFPQGVKKLVGSEKNYRIRIGDYRVIYTVEEKTIKIVSILHRRDAYR
ncbi:type II toxin-antitoxin system RelE/ParE family toxin [bacterium]|nr:type II toxin-antitoxin system RelE/ParE family toxin [bacterium]